MEDPPFTIGDRIVVRQKKTKHYRFPCTVLGWGKSRYNVIFDDPTQEGCFIEFRLAYPYSSPPPPHRVPSINQELAKVGGPLFELPPTKDPDETPAIPSEPSELPNLPTNVSGNTISNLTTMLHQLTLATATAIAARSIDEEDVNRQVYALSERIRRQANDIVNYRRSG